MKNPSPFFRLRLLLVAGALLAAVWLLSTGRTTAQEAVDQSGWTEVMRRQYEDSEIASMEGGSYTPCDGGMAGIYPCDGVNLLSIVTHGTMGGPGGNDIWGWTDPETDREYALVGQTNGTAFVDVSDPVNPVYLGRLNSHTGTATWRDVKVYANHAYIVSDGNGAHGMQIFDLTQLRDVPNPPVTFAETGWYNNGINSSHNVAINEDTGFAYVVGSAQCSGGLHMVDLSNPANPAFAGCYSGDGYTHDVQCVVYNGPDTDYVGNEICFASNTDTLTIVDVTDKANPVMLAREPYTGANYSHQGWLTDDHAYFLLGDELDEQNLGINTTTYLWDLADLTAPVNFDNYVAALPSTDHNLYVLGNYVYESNYSSGTRILDLTDIANGNLVEEAYFDTYPPNDNANFNGQWSNYPYFESGVLIANDRGNGLFVLQPLLYPYVLNITPDMSDEGQPGDTVEYTVTIMNNGTADDTYDLALSGESWNSTLSVNSISLDSGEIDTFTVSVEIPGGATPGDADTVTVTATSTGDGSVTDEADLTTSIPQAYAFNLTGDQSAEGQPGETVDYTMTITNTGNGPDTFELVVSGESWTTTLSDSSLTLDAGDSGSFTVSVEIPGDADPGSSDTATVTATSVGDPSVSDSADVTTSVLEASYGVEVMADGVSKSGQPDTTVGYSVTVTNTGSVTDTFDLLVSGDEWTTTLSEDSVTLGAGSSTVITLSVTIPADAVDGDIDIITLSATSNGDPGVSDSLNLTTSAEVEVVEPNFPTYLPIMLSQP